MISRRKYRKSPGRIEKEKRYQMLNIYERFYYRYDRWWLQQYEFMFTKNTVLLGSL